MKVRFNQDVNINGALHPAGSEEEMEGRLTETLLARGWAVDVEKEAQEKEAAKEAAKVVEMPKKRTYETAVKKQTEKAVTVEKPAAKKPAKKAKPKKV